MKNYDKLIYKKVGNRIQYLRKECGKSQRDIADVLYVDESYISKIETGACGISLPALFRLADAIGVSAADLVNVKWENQFKP